MTLVLAAVSRESIWLVADRRLSANGSVVKDDARKIAFLETPDGEAILGYAGLGRTPRRVEPCDWMNAVLRGHNRLLGAALSTLADAAREEVPPLLLKVKGATRLGHTILAPAFLNGVAAMYTIDIVVHADRQRYAFQFGRHAAFKTPSGQPVPPRILAAGAGMNAIAAQPKLRQQLRYLLRAHDRRAISSLAVADHLSEMNDAVHRSSVDKTVGPRSIVAWRFRKNGPFGGGGGHQFYTGVERDQSSEMLPTVANGMNVSGLVQAITPTINDLLQKMMAEGRSVEVDRATMDALTQSVPMTPDRKLR